MVVALPTLVTGPVKLAFVVTVPAVRPVAVPVRLVATPLDGVPSAPPLMTGAPAVPTFTPSAVGKPVPRPVMPDSGAVAALPEIEIGHVPDVPVPVSGAPPRFAKPLAAVVAPMPPLVMGMPLGK